MADELTPDVTTREEREADVDEVEGVPLSRVHKQVLVEPMEDYRPAGPTEKEFEEYRRRNDTLRKGQHARAED